MNILKLNLKMNVKKQTAIMSEAIEYIVFSGGAQRGNAFIGALSVLMDFLLVCKKSSNHSFRGSFRGFGGTSIGALVALACTIGIQPKQMKQWALQQDTSDFISQMGLSTFFTTRGLLSQNYLQKHILGLFFISLFKEKLTAKTTMKELYDLTNIHLRVTASNMSQQVQVIYDYLLTPNCPVLHAVSTSMSIPILVEPTVIAQENRIYMGGGPFDCIVDGGSYDNYPITLFPIEKTIGFQLTLGYGAAARFGHRLVSTALSKEFTVAEYLGNIISNTVDYYEQRILTLLPPIYSARTVSICIPQCSFKEMITAPKTLIQSYILIAEMTMLFYCFPNHCIFSIFIWFAFCSQILFKFKQQLSKNENSLATDIDSSGHEQQQQQLKKSSQLDNKSNKE